MRRPVPAHSEEVEDAPPVARSGAQMVVCQLYIVRAAG
jgi:hypothetical protein